MNIEYIVTFTEADVKECLIDKVRSNGVLLPKGYHFEATRRYGYADWMVETIKDPEPDPVVPVETTEEKGEQA